MNLTSAIAEFAESMSSTKTAATYSVPLRRFAANITATQTQELTVEHVAAFAKSLPRHLSPKTIRTYLTAVGIFYHYLLTHKMLRMDASDSAMLDDTIKRRKPTSTPLPHPMPDIVLAAILTAAAEPARNSEISQRTAKSAQREQRARLIPLRNVALLHVLRSTGARVAELRHMTLADIDLSAGEARVHGKGRKDRRVYLDDTAVSALRAYLAERKTTSASPLIAAHSSSTDEQPIRADWHIERLLKKMLTAAGIGDRWTPHSLRHRFATKLAAENDLLVVQTLMGHASPTTTEVYIKLSQSKMRDAHRNTNLGIS